MKKLSLEVLDFNGNITTSHNLYYETSHGNRLRLNINDNVYIMDNCGKLVIMTQEDFEREALINDAKQINLGVDKEWADKLKKRLENDCELPLKVWRVCYKNPFVDDKGNALYITLEARSARCAEAKAMANEEFRNHINFKHFDEKYLNTYIPVGKYELDRIDYFEGDPRL